MSYDGIIKIAKQLEENNSNVGAGITSLGGAGLLAGKSVDPLLGAKDIYHGSSSENIKNILKEGLDPLRGGSSEGVAAKVVKDPMFVKRLKNRVYVTPTKSVAQRYADVLKGGILSGKVSPKLLANLHVDPEGFIGFLPNLAVIETLKKETPLGIKLTRQLLQDNLRDATNNLDRILTSIERRGQNIPIEDIRLRKKFIKAFGEDSKVTVPKIRELIREQRKAGVYGTEKIPAHVFGKGLKNKMLRTKDYVKDLPFHIKNDPKRFGKGVGGLGLAAALTGLGYNLIGD